MATVIEKHAPLRRREGGRPRAVQGRRTSSLAEFGRKEIRLAEQEMPGLMALRKQHGGEQAARRRARSWAACT